MLVLLLAVFAAKLFIHAQKVAVADENSRAPNIVVILADDLGYGDLSCYGQNRYRTPHLDRMAAEGARFTQFNTPMPFCGPTRAALLTGRYPFRCGFSRNPAPDGAPAADELGLPTSETTLADLLKEAGYATACIGKWHLGHQPEFWPTRRGFDIYFGIPYSNDMRPVALFDGEERVEYPVVQATLTQRYTDRAIEFIEHNKDRPFFLYLPHAMPHKPLAASEKFYQQSGAGLYGDVIVELDHCVGQVLSKLKELELDERTLTIFTSDNGPWFGGSTAGLRGMKSTTWEGGYRVPFILRWPGRVPGGQTREELAVTMDVFATALAAAGVEFPKERVIDGRDLLPLATGEGGDVHEFICGQRGGDIHVIRDARWKLHVRAPRDLRIGAQPRPDGTVPRWIDPRGPDGVTILAPYEQYQPTAHPGVATGDAPTAPMLFDLKADPGEQRNVAEKHPEQVKRLTALLESVQEEGNRPR